MYSLLYYLFPPYTFVNVTKHMVTWLNSLLHSGQEVTAAFFPVTLYFIAMTTRGSMSHQNVHSIWYEIPLLLQESPSGETEGSAPKLRLPEKKTTNLK